MSEPSADGPVIVAARRTPVRTARPPAIDPVELAAGVLSAVAAELAEAGITTVDDVVLGSARGPGGNLARVSALAAGLGLEVPGVSVDRQCGSGLEAVRLAAALVGSGSADVVLAGGVESASAAIPGRAAFAPPGFADPEMGVAAEDLARVAGISRARQDASRPLTTARAAAPSLIPQELPAVTVPPGQNAAGIRASTAGVNRRRGRSSWVIPAVGTSSAANRPSSCAAADSRCERSA